MRVHANFLISSDVEQTTGGVVGPGGEHVAVWKKGDRVYVRLVAWESLLAKTFADIPELGRRVTGT